MSKTNRCIWGFILVPMPYVGFGWCLHVSRLVVHVCLPTEQNPLVCTLQSWRQPDFPDNLPHLTVTVTDTLINNQATIAILL